MVTSPLRLPLLGHNNLPIIIEQNISFVSKVMSVLRSLLANPVSDRNNNNNIFILYSAKSMYSSKRFTIKRCDIASLQLIRNVKCASIFNIRVKIMLNAINN